MPTIELTLSRLIAAAPTVKATPESVPVKPEHLQGLFVLLVIAGVIGVMVVVLLSIAWRRHNTRIREERRRRAEEVPDAWQAAGDRLTARLDKTHRWRDAPHESSIEDKPDTESDEEPVDEDDDEDHDDDEDETDPRPH